MKRITRLLTALIIFSSVSFSQLSISGGGIDYIINFDSTLSGVLEGQFTGIGFTPTPANGQLNSNAWAVTGVSDGTLNFGDTQTTGDFARGTSSGSIITGGIYAFVVVSSNNTFGIQPATGDFSPGSITLRVLNNTAGSITALNLSYNIYALNDQARSNSLNLYYSYDSVTYFLASSFNYSSPETADPSPAWNFTNKTGVLTGFNIKVGEYLYLRWLCDDVSGSGERDELALDDITLNAVVTTLTIVHLANTSLTANESDGTFNVNVSIQNPSATTTSVDLVLLNSGTYSGDVSGFTSQTVTFPPNDGNDQSVAVTITDDVLSEGIEDLYFLLSNAGGGNSAFIGVPDTFHLTILDNELVDLVINEVLADPDGTSGDANGDGIIDVTDDEFIEIVNNELFSIDLTGWTISDISALRHNFTSGTILNSNNVITVFGGGTPTGIPGLTQTATHSFGLQLNNGGDSLAIKNSSGAIVAYIVYGVEGGNNESLARNPDVTGTFVLHTTIATNPVAFSPGKKNTDGSPLPVELTSFEAFSINNAVQLKWTTATEVNNYGFEVERKVSSNSPQGGEQNNYDWDKIGFVNGNGNSNSPKYYSFEDKDITFSQCCYRLKQFDNNGSFEYSQTIEINLTQPNEFQLSQNYPNPFNPSTKIRYTVAAPILPNEEVFENVEEGFPDGSGQATLSVLLKVYDILGNEVATLVNEQQAPGNYEVEFNTQQTTNNRQLTSGVYFYKLQVYPVSGAGSFVETKKMILLK